MANYAINGFGRIGRMVLRSMSDDELKKVVAINDLTDNKTLAHLLKYDSSQGQFAREVSYDEGHIIVDGHKIHATAERDPANLPWGDWNADVILESTGFFCSREGASKHLSAGAKKVLISAPASDPDHDIALARRIALALSLAVVVCCAVVKCKLVHAQKNGALLYSHI